MRKNEAKRKKRAVGYLRVSTQNQDDQKIKNNILQLANEKHFGHIECIFRSIPATDSD